MVRELQTKRARFAHERVSKWPQQWGEEALARVKGLPVALRSQGLATALATLIADERVHTQRLAELIADWILKECPYSVFDGNKTSSEQSAPRRLLELCTAAEPSEYIAAESEALAIVEQVKLFASAIVARK